MLSQASRTRARICANSSSNIYAPFIWKRSRYAYKAGEMYRPTRIPACRKALSINAQTEPLPLVPAT